MAQLLEINRTSIYWIPARPSEIELQAKRIIDEIHTKNPTWGSRQLSGQLKERNLLIGRLKTPRYVEEFRKIVEATLTVDYAPMKGKEAQLSGLHYTR